MNKIIEYVMVERHELLSFHMHIQEWIDKGFQPYGSPFARPNSNVCQAMVKYAYE